MVKMIVAQNLSIGWVKALDHLLACGGKDTNVVVVIEHINDEDIRVRNIVDEFLQHRQKSNGKSEFSTTTVANTIFPLSLYNHKRGVETRPFLYQVYKERCFPVLKRLHINSRGTYFYRMIAWPGKNGEVNQIEEVIQRLKNELRNSNAKSSAYEIGISMVGDCILSYSDEIHIYQPGRDRQVMGFPCLSHISLTLVKRRLHLTALYRNQHFIHKAYGNYMGLCRLLSFLCQEVECEPGELTCIASHADCELNLGKRALNTLLETCKFELMMYDSADNLEVVL